MAGLKAPKPSSCIQSNSVRGEASTMAENPSTVRYVASAASGPTPWRAATTAATVAHKQAPPTAAVVTSATDARPWRPAHGVFQSIIME